MMKRILPTMLCFLLLSSIAVAEITLPSFNTFSEIEPVEIRVTENDMTSSVVYSTDMVSIEAYQQLIMNSGFAMNGSWVLPGDENYKSLAVYSYLYTGNERPSSFKMKVGEDEVSSNMLLQVIQVDNSEVLLMLTCNKSIEFYDYIRLTPEPIVQSDSTPAVTDMPGGHIEYVTVTEKCFNCHGSGICPLCHGTGTYRNYGVSVPCEKDCGTCGGTGELTHVDARWVYD